MAVASRCKGRRRRVARLGIPLKTNSNVLGFVAEEKSEQPPYQFIATRSPRIIWRLDSERAGKERFVRCVKAR